MKILASFEFFIIAAVVAVCAGFSKGGFEQGEAFITPVIITSIIKSGQAIEKMLLVLMLMDVKGIKSYLGKQFTKKAFFLCDGGLSRIFLAVCFLNR